MLKFVSRGDISQAQTEAVLVCEMDDFLPHQQGLLPAVVWERYKRLKESPKWVPGAIQVLRKPDTKKPMQVAFPGNLKVVFANVRDEAGIITYRSIRDVLRKLKEIHQEKLDIKSICTVFPGLNSGREFSIQSGLIRSLLRTLFEEENLGAPSGLYVEVYEPQVE
jgi:hypothetical protein